MKTFIINIDKRKGFSSNLGPYKTLDKAREALKKYVEKSYTPEAIKYCLSEFGGNFGKGEFYSEEESIYITENEVE
jgi:hypothetical protein